MTKLCAALAAALLGLSLWQGIVLLTGVPAFILPPPWRVAQTAWENRALIGENAIVTATEIALGLAFGTGLGVCTAILMAASNRLHNLAMPMLIFTQSIPVFALAPILTLWLGYGLASKVMMAVLIIYFPVTSAFYDGLTRIPRDLTDLAQTMGGTKWQIMRHIRIPHARPALGTGLKLAAVSAPIGAVIGEWVGASKGLGYLMLLANGRAKTDLMFASLLTLTLMTITLYFAVSKLATWLARN